jgi:hypothetical protein
MSTSPVPPPPYDQPDLVPYWTLWHAVLTRVLDWSDQQVVDWVKEFWDDPEPDGWISHETPLYWISPTLAPAGISLDRHEQFLRELAWFETHPAVRGELDRLIPVIKRVRERYLILRPESNPSTGPSNSPRSDSIGQIAAGGPLLPEWKRIWHRIYRDVLGWTSDESAAAIDHGILKGFDETDPAMKALLTEPLLFYIAHPLVPQGLKGEEIDSFLEELFHLSTESAVEGSHKHINTDRLLEALRRLRMRWERPPLARQEP